MEIIIGLVILGFLISIALFAFQIVMTLAMFIIGGVIAAITGLVGLVRGDK